MRKPLYGRDWEGDPRQGLERILIKSERYHQMGNLGSRREIDKGAISFGELDSHEFDNSSLEGHSESHGILIMRIYITLYCWQFIV